MNGIDGDVPAERRNGVVTLSSWDTVYIGETHAIPDIQNKVR
jgi:hypothetical protein